MTVWLWLQSIQLTLLKCQPWLSPPGLSMHSRSVLGVCGSVVECLSKNRLPRPNSPQELWIPDPAGIFFPICSWAYSTDACALLLQGLQGKEETVETGTKEISCHGKSIHPQGQHRGGWSPVSFTLSSSGAPVCVQDSCLNSAFSDNIRSTPPTSLLVHARRLSVWMWFLQLKTPAWYPATGQSSSVTALGQGGHLFSTLKCTDPSISCSLS